MSKIVIFLCVTVLVTNLAVAKPQGDDEELAQEVQELLDYQRNLLTNNIFPNDFADFEEDSNEDQHPKCIRPLHRCCESRQCCSKLRCSKLLGRCLPKFGPPKPTENSLNM